MASGSSAISDVGKQVSALINSLAMGFRILGLRFELLLVPIALSAAVLFLPPADLSFFSQEMDAILQEFPFPSEQGGYAVMLDEILSSQNFSSFPIGPLLVNRSFFRVPGLVRPFAQEQAQVQVWQISVWRDFASVAAALFLGGVAVGAGYLYWLGQHIPSGTSAPSPPAAAIPADSPEPATANPGPSFWVRLGQMLLYFLLLAGIWMGSSLLAALLSLAGAALMGFILAFYFIAILIFLLYQTYVAAGVMLDGLSAWQALRHSAQLVHHNRMATLVFLVLAGFILWGMESLLDIFIDMVRGHRAIILIASVFFAYVGTGVALAFLVFYRTRCLQQQGMDITRYLEVQED